MNANYEKKIIEMTKTESKAAGKVGTDEYMMLKELRAENPGLLNTLPSASHPFHGLQKIPQQLHFHL